VDHGPNQEGPRSRGDIGFLSGVVDVGGSSNSIDIATQEENIDENVYNLQKRVRNRGERITRS
jgi:hypothetical protein